ncbi:hypothetical protein Hdeb2414_s0026g00674911 [Helianthus debilis subsp. tardiflorus]
MGMGNCSLHKRAPAPPVENINSGIPTSLAASSVKPMSKSDTIQVTGEKVTLNLAIRLLKGCKQFSCVDLHISYTFWVTSVFSGGVRPSGMASNRNVGTLLRASKPCDLTRRRWVNSVLTKVMRKPLEWRILASFIIGLRCP